MTTVPLLHSKSHSSILPLFCSSTANTSCQEQRSHSHLHQSFNKLDSDDDDNDNDLISNAHPSSSTSAMAKSHLSLARVILVICIAFAMMALVHLHYAKFYRQADESTATTVDKHHLFNTHNDPTQPPDQELLLSPYEPTPTAMPTLVPAPAQSPEPTVLPEPKFTVTDTALTTSVRYSNGTITKTFKPAFYKDVNGARNEMGSFLETLKNRAWWTHNAQGNSLSAQTAKGTPVTERFFAYLPMGGGNNQFTALQKAALLAKDLKRTLLIPPISPNSHIKVWSGPRYSEFYNLESFSADSGIPVLEWHDIKQTPDNPTSDFTHQWLAFSEEFPCIPNGSIGVKNKNLYDHFRRQFLMNFKAIAPGPGIVDTTQGRSGNYTFARDVLLRDTETADDASQMWKCLSCPYFLGGGNVNERSWDEIGLHMRFNDKIEAMADDILDMLLPPAKKPLDGSNQQLSTARRHAEFIIIHLRRGDIVTKCKPGQDEKECLVQIEEIAEKVDAIERERRIQVLKSSNNNTSDDMVLERLPVLVATNEKRPGELEKLVKLGWIMLDHGDQEVDAKGNEVPSRSKKLGTMKALGPFYPPMLDAVLLTRGDYLIGMSNSRMSQLAAQRGAAWYKHKTMLM